MDIEKVRAEIITAIREFQSNGGVLIRESYGVTFDNETHQWKTENKYCACALGCVLLRNQMPIEGMFNYSAAQALGVSDDFVDAFIQGFDGFPMFDFNREAHALGREIAMMFNPMYYEQVPDPDEDEDDYDYGRDPDLSENYGLN